MSSAVVSALTFLARVQSSTKNPPKELTNTVPSGTVTTFRSGFVGSGTLLCSRNRTLSCKPAPQSSSLECSDLSAHLKLSRHKEGNAVSALTEGTLPGRHVHSHWAGHRDLDAVCKQRFTSVQCAILAQINEPFQPAPTFIVSADVLEEPLRPPEITVDVCSRLCKPQVTCQGYAVPEILWLLPGNRSNLVLQWRPTGLQPGNQMMQQMLGLDSVP